MDKFETVTSGQDHFVFESHELLLVI